MNSTQNQLLRPTWAVLILAAALGSAPALAAGKTGLSDAQARYQRDRALCASSRHASDRDDCLSEASTAFASAQPVTVDPDPGRYARNALKRCEPLTEPDRGDCVSRIQGLGTISGSVAGGGIYRELVTREIGLPVAATADPAPPAIPVIPAK